jgi:hypothetical protein
LSKESNDYKRSNAMESRSNALTDRASNIKCEKYGCTSELIIRFQSRDVLRLGPSQAVPYYGKLTLRQC